MADVQRLGTVIDSVTVFNRAALISRIGALPDLSGKTSATFTIAGLPLSLDASSVRVSVVDKSGWKESDGTSQQTSKRIKLVHRSGWTVRHISPEIDRIDSEDVETREDLSQTILALEAERDQVMFCLSGISAEMGEVMRWMASPLQAGSHDGDEEYEPHLFPYAAWEAFMKTCAARLEELHTRERSLSHRHAALTRELQMKEELQSGKRLRIPGEVRYCKNLTVSLVRFGESSHQPESLEISYVVPGAQWKPVYKLYISDDFKKAKLVMGAQVAQRSGEEWPEVALRFSAASFHRITQLPELPSRRIGRVQPPRTQSYREKLPPPESLFSAYDAWRRGQRAISAPVPMTLNAFFEECERKLSELLSDTDTTKVRPMGMMIYRSEASASPVVPASSIPQPAYSVIEEYGSLGKGDELHNTGELAGYVPMAPPQAPPRVQAPMPSQPPPPLAKPARHRVDEKQRKMAGPAKANLESRLKKGLDYLKESAVLHRTAPGAERFADVQEQMAGDLEGYPQSEDFDGTSYLMDDGVTGSGMMQQVPDYFNYELGDAETQKQFRGQLRRVRSILFSPRIAEQESEVVKKIDMAIRKAEVNLISESELPNFQCVYEAGCRAHIPSDGHPHTVNILVGLSPSVMNFRTVPMTDSKVFRRLTLRNPFPFPLPGGEVQAFLENAYLLSTPFNGVGKDGELLFPLGVEPRLRVARNTTFTQDEKGIVGENSLASHCISIQVRSHMPEPVTLEILERIPIKDESEKKIDIRLIASEPRSEQMEFIDEVRVRGTHRWSLEVKPGDEISARLEYRISIPSKMEIVGGNRRV